MSILYPKITANVQDVLKLMDKANLIPKLVPLTGTTKLHGTHADLVILQTGEIRYQSRNVMNLAPGKNSDNMKFAETMQKFQKNILILADHFFKRYEKLNPKMKLEPLTPLILAGEWIGKGIQKGVAINELQENVFVIVSVYINGYWQPDGDYADLCDENAKIYSVSRGGFFKVTLDRTNYAESMKQMRALTKDVVNECPFAKSLGLKGTGEGIVWKPDGVPTSEPGMWLKTKGAEFSGRNDNKVENVKNVNENQRAAALAEAFVTEARLQQGLEYLREMHIAQGMEGLGRFLKWIQDDILLEENAEIERVGLEKAALRKEISKLAKPWYTSKIF